MKVKIKSCVHCEPVTVVKSGDTYLVHHRDCPELKPKWCPSCGMRVSLVDIERGRCPRCDIKTNNWEL